MNITAEKQTVGSFVAQDFRTAALFQKYDIDFCCKGGQTLDEVCTQKKLEKTNLVNELEAIIQSTGSANDDFNRWNLDQLIDYIITKHHTYISEKTPVILTFLDKLCQVHGSRHPELFEIAKEFHHVAEELSMHMKKEELILFPYIKHLVKAKAGNESLIQPGFGSVGNPISMMKEEHSLEGERLAHIAALSQNYTPPSDGCTTYQVSFQMLQEFEKDLHLHIHLENNILFPKSIAIEKSMQS
mgnify:CR=1 FL=1